MTFENEGTVHFAFLCPFGAMRAQGHSWGTVGKNELCPPNSLFSFLFSLKGHRAQIKEGDAEILENTGKYTYKERKGVKRRKYSRVGKNCALCPLGFSA